MYQIKDILNTVICGDVLAELKKIPDESIDTICTSPPYWGLRDYGVKGQLGLEPTLEEYLEKLLKITAELHRVLKKSGVMFWNHGDCYGGSGNGSWNAPIEIRGKQYRKCLSIDQEYLGPPRKDKFVQPKCLALQNWRLILKMLDTQGWILRNSIVWHKSNAMPSSVKDRFANKYEMVFMLVKNKKYFFDLDSVRIPSTTLENRPYGVVREREFGYNTGFLEARKSFNYRVRDSSKKSEQCPQFKATKEEIEKYKALGHQNPNRVGRDYKDPEKSIQSKMEWYQHKRKGRGSNNPALNNRNFMPIKNIDPRGSDKGGPGSWRIFKEDNPSFTNPLGKNPGDVWQIATQPCPREFRGVHFATFPEKLVEPMILAGCPKDGIVLDPFCGLGTVGVVAKKLKRNFIGIDIKEEYCEMARQRIRNTPEPLF